DLLVEFVTVLLGDRLAPLPTDLLVELVAALLGDLLAALLPTALAGLRCGHLSVLGILRLRHGESFLRQKRKKGTAGRHPLSRRQSGGFSPRFPALMSSRTR